MSIGSLPSSDLELIRNRLPKDVLRMLEQFRGLCVAGGFCRAVIAGEEPNDIDVFGSSVELMMEAFDYLKDCRPNAEGFDTKNAMTLYSDGRPVQFIKRWVFPHRIMSNTLEQVVRAFDFTVCRVAVGYARYSNEFLGYCDERFYQDLAARRLTYVRPDKNAEPAASLMRVLKFVKRGYNIQPESLGLIVAHTMTQIKNKNRDDMDEEEPRPGSPASSSASYEKSTR